MESNNPPKKPTIDLPKEAAGIRDNLLDINAISAMLGIHKATIYRLKDFPEPKKVGNQNRWWLPDIVAYINRA